MVTRAQRTMTESRLTTTTLMTPDLANFAGNVHGGHILRLVDQIAYACAASYSGEYCVTLSVDRVLFKVPVHVGDLVTMKAQVNRAGRTSLEVGVRVEARDLRGGAIRHTNSCFLTMVAMREGYPQIVPELIPETDEDRRRNEQAQRRQEQSRLVDQVSRERVRHPDLIELSSVATLVSQAASGVVKRTNQAACDLLLRPRDQIIGAAVWDLFTDRQAVQLGHERAERAGFSDFQCEVPRAEQRTLVQVTAWRIPLPSGALLQSILR